MTRTTNLFDCNSLPWGSSMLLAGLLAGSILVSPVSAQSSAPSTPRAPDVAATPAATTGTPTRYRPSRFPARAAAFYPAVWGVDSLTVRTAESGELIRFSYRVLDPDKASPLNDKKNEPALIAPDAHVKLVIPTLEKVGQLRQSSPPEAGRLYWMAFSNPGRPVKRGDCVNIVIGDFHAYGLVVE